jgi:hypothetical protein
MKVATSANTGGSNMPVEYCDLIVRAPSSQYTKRADAYWVSALLVQRA